MSAATSARKAGVPEMPSGAASTRLALAAAHAAESVPLAVTGEPVTESSAGSDSPTLVTVPGP